MPRRIEVDRPTAEPGQRRHSSGAVARTTAPSFVKRDRTARLLGVANLLYQHPGGLLPREIAQRVGVSIRTVYRDLQALESEVGVAVWQDRGRFAAEKASFLPPLELTLAEAVTIYQSTRLIARHRDYRDPNAISAFNKLGGILPLPIAQHVHAAVGALSAQPRNEDRVRILNLLASAWAEGRKVRIWYASRRSTGEFVERLISPYVLEPNLTGHSVYLIGHDSQSGQLRTFKLERVQKAELTDERFSVPADFEPGALIGRAWGISDEDLVDVRVRFRDPQAAARATETRWHPSQRELRADDNTVDLLFQVNGSLEIMPWILSWGGSVEVLEPPELRARIVATAHQLASLYHFDRSATD
jgi:predicted DNA-binding transcriptional regulator YafY